MNITLQVFDALGALKTSITIPEHTHTSSLTGGQLTDAALSAAVGIAKGGTGQTTKTPAFDALAPGTTKGDIIVYDGTDNVRLPVGINGQILTANSAATNGAEWASPSALGLIILEEQQTAGTDAGTFTSGSFSARAINAEVVDTGGFASITGGGAFTLAAGTYEIVEASAPALVVNGHMIRLRNTTDSTTVSNGTSEFSGASGQYCNTRSSIVGNQFTIASTKTFELQHRCETTRASDGRGQAANIGEVEVYARISLKKIA